MESPKFSFEEYFAHFNQVQQPAGLNGKLEGVARLIEATAKSGGKIIFAGNGASAALASHAALDFTKQAKVRSMSFNETALITALVNDFGGENWTAKAVELYGDAGDLMVFISCSGKSPNLLRAAEMAKKKGIRIVSFTGQALDNPLNQLSDQVLWANSYAYNVVEAVHALWLMAVCDALIGTMTYKVS